jgi:hypothetical protein
MAVAIGPSRPLVGDTKVLDIQNILIILILKN